MNAENLRIPRTVALFEAGSILPAIAMMALSSEVGGFGDLVWLIAWGALTLWITRGRRPIARLFYTALILLQGGMFANAYIWNDVKPWDYAILFGSLAVSAALMTLLWWPSTSLWLRNPRTT